ncbi:MAG TPA: DUF1326 domain-containing protein [Candidatus Dormibacteraeota bacterium]
MAWQIQGTYFENCSCDMVCPCTTSGLAMPADQDRCRVVLVFHVDSGSIDSVDVGGLTVAIVADTPPVMADGNWRVGVFMDQRASDEQAGKLGGVFSGQMGGPMGALAPLISEMLGIERAAITYTDDGRRHRVSIGDAVDIEIEDFIPAGGQEVSRLTGMAHPANSTLTIARATASRVNAFGLQFSNNGKNGHSAPFAWAA